MKNKINDHNQIRTRLVIRVRNVVGLGLGCVLFITLSAFSWMQYEKLKDDARTQAGFAAESIASRLNRDATDIETLSEYLQVLLREGPDGLLSEKDKIMISTILNAFLKSRDGQVIAIGIHTPGSEPIIIGNNSEIDLEQVNKKAFTQLRKLITNSKNIPDGFLKSEIISQDSIGYLFTSTKRYLFSEAQKNKNYRKSGSMVLGIVSNSKYLQDSFINLGFQIKKSNFDVEYKLLSDLSEDIHSKSKRNSLDISYRTSDEKFELASARRFIPELLIDGHNVIVQATIISSSFLFYMASWCLIAIFGIVGLLFLIRMALDLGIEAEVKPLIQLGTNLKNVIKANFAEPIIADGSTEVINIASKIESMRLAMISYLEKNKELSQSAAVARMTQMLAHDVRKPFSILRMGLGMLRNSKGASETKSVISRLTIEVDKALSSVDGMIADVMEIGSKNQNLSKEEVSLKTIIGTSLDEAFRVFTSSKINISYNLEHTHMLHVNAQKVGRVFSNIIGNALQAIKNEGDLWFKTTEKFDYVEICVGNSRSFIPPENIKKLFDDFFTSNKIGGTGLGLAIAKKIVLSHNGLIWCQSEKNHTYPTGKVEFFFTLPLALRSIDENLTELPETSDEVNQKLSHITGDNESSNIDIEFEKNISEIIKNAGRPLGILIVEDNPSYRQALSSLLDSNILNGIVDVWQSSCDQSSFSILRKRKIDLVITDVNLGNTSINGFELAKTLRQQDDFQGFICIHSDRIDIAYHRMALESGADAFLPKPMGHAQMLKLCIQAGLLQSTKLP